MELERLYRLALFLIHIARMVDKLVKYFFWLAAGLLITAALSKLISAFGNAQILNRGDVLLRIPHRAVFVIAAAAELLVAWVCLKERDILWKSTVLAWLASGFVMYHLGLLWIHYPAPCKCLGSLTDKLHITPQMARILMLGIVAYLALGSYTILACQHWKHRSQKS